MSDLARPPIAAPDDGDARPAARRRSPRRAERDGLLDVAYRTVDSPLGPLLLAATPAGLVRVAFAGEGHDAVLGDARRRRQPAGPARRRRASTTSPASSTSTSPARRRAFDVPVDLRLAHGFRREVLEHLRDDPLRRDRELRRRSPAPPARRTRCGPPARACATNPVPLVVPCHRVVRSDGSIGQYRGGVEAKRLLLALEAA